MKSIQWILLAACISCTFQRDKTGGAFSGLIEAPSCAPISFAQVQVEIFGTPQTPQGKCLMCHQLGGPLMALDSYTAVKSRLAQIEDSVRSNRMPRNGPLSVDKKRLLFSWIQQGSPELADSAKITENCNPGVVEPIPDPNPQPVAIEPNYESLRQHIFASRCFGCHDSSGIFSIYDFSSYESIVSYQKFFELPIDGSDSRFVKALVSGSMPKNSTPLSVEQIEVIRQWVALGLPRVQEDVGTPLPTPDQPPTPIPQPPTNSCDQIDFKTVNEKVFAARCINCHDQTSNFDFQSYSKIKNHITEIRWMISTDKMPPKKPLSPDLKDLVLKWIDQGAVETVQLPDTCIVNPNPTPPSLAPLTATYNSMREHFLEKKCIACHMGEISFQKKGQNKKPDFSTYQIMASQSDLFDFKRPERSEIIKVILDGEMPPASAAGKKLTREELDIMIEWIRRGIPEGS